MKTFFDLIKDKICSANVYIDSFNIAKALELGADIVLTGRVSDPGLVLGPCIYEFNWTKSDYDLLASGTVAGHIIECGAQCSGGNFSRWDTVENLANIGYPIVEITANGEFTIEKDDKWEKNLPNFSKFSIFQKNCQKLIQNDLKKSRVETSFLELSVNFSF